MPHATAEEQVLYLVWLVWSQLVGYAGAAAPMVHDNPAIGERVERLEQTDTDDVETLQELLYGLYALIKVHFGKEEDIQLLAFDAASAEFTKAVLERMEQATHGNAARAANLADEPTILSQHAPATRLAAEPHAQHSELYENRYEAIRSKVQALRARAA